MENSNQTTCRIESPPKDPPAPLGEGEGYLVGSIDISNPRDLGLLAEAIRRGWQINPERKQTYFAALDDLIRDAGERPFVEQAAVVIAANRLLQMEQSSALKRLHKLEEYERLDAGKPTAKTQHILVSDTPIRARQKPVHDCGR